MVNYILLHGAWHGSWIFNRVLPKLDAKLLGDASVFALDLPGHGSNMVENLGDVTLQDYVDHVCDFITKKNLHDVILVGHSMSGVVISQVAENLHTRIKKLIYLSAFVPTDQGSLIEEEKKAKHPSVALQVKIDDKRNVITLDKKHFTDLFYQKCNKADADFALSHVQEQPLHPFLDSVSLSNKFHSLQKVYIECLDDVAIHIDDQRRMNKTGFHKIVSMKSDHSPFFSDDDALVDLLLKA